MISGKTRLPPIAPRFKRIDPAFLSGEHCRMIRATASSFSETLFTVSPSASHAAQRCGAAFPLQGAKEKGTHESCDLDSDVIARFPFQMGSTVAHSFQ